MLLLQRYILVQNPMRKLNADSAFHFPSPVYHVHLDSVELQRTYEQEQSTP